MKVLHLGKYYPPHMGGMETYLQQLVIYQSKAMDVDVIVANGRRSTEIECMDGARIIRVATFGTIASMPIIPTLPWHVRQNNADIVHLDMPNPGAAFALLSGGHSGKIVITHHADTVGRKQLRRLADPFIRRVMERSAAIIVTSQGYLDSSDELVPYRNKCEIIPSGFDPAPFVELDSTISRGIREKYGERLVLAVGRLVPYKGFEYLIRSMRGVNGVLVVVGTGPLRESLQNCIHECGVQDKVILLGHVDEITPYYQAAAVFVMPSINRAEAFGLVQVEAMAAGIPVINTRIPSGVPEVSVHNLTGLTVPPNDPEALTQSINRLLDNSSFRQQLGAAARKRAFEKYSFEKIAAATMFLYERVMRNTGVTL